MNFLSLCQRLLVECAATNVTLSTAQSPVGEAVRFVNWINQAWTELQTMHDDWEWMRSSNLLGGGVSFVPVAGVANTPLGTGPGTLNLDPSLFGGKWVIDSFRNYVTTVGPQSEIFMPHIGFDWWRDSYMYGANRFVQTRPAVFAVGSDKSICVGPASNGLYTVTGDYFAAPTSMSADTDLPIGLPNQYHMILVYQGMIYYGTYEAAPEIATRGMDGYQTLLTQLERRYGPRVRLAGALA
jgi:hypothetical protein